MLNLDQNITFWLYIGNTPAAWLKWLIFAIATGAIYLLPVMLIIFFFQGGKRRLASVKLFLSSVIAWQVLSKLIGDYVYGRWGFRDRPFETAGLKELLFEKPQKAFPSDHAAVATVVILLLFYLKMPKLGWMALIAGILMMLARVMIGFHWTGDIIGGWLVGAVVFGLMVAIDKPLDKLLTGPLRINSTYDHS